MFALGMQSFDLINKLTALRAVRRMGQRARRQLAEKQFGGGARHLTLTPPDGGEPASVAKLGLAPKHSNGLAPGRAAATSAETLHPSWAAKREQRGSGLVPAAGKKVVFSDDGAVVRVASTSAANAAAPDAADRGIGKDRAGPRNGVRSSGKELHAAQTGREARNASAVGHASLAQTTGNKIERVVRHGVRFRSNEAAMAGSGTESRKPVGRGGLHPSWEAKKLLRQQAERLPAPKGAKVVFQDSD